MTLSQVEDKLHPMVPKVLWAVAGRTFGFPIDKGIRSAKLLLPDADSINPKTLQGYQRFAQDHNHLVDIHEDLLFQLPYPTVEISQETSLSTDPVVRMTNEASKALIGEMKQIESRLYQARVTLQNQL